MARDILHCRVVCAPSGSSRQVKAGTTHQWEHAVTGPRSNNGKNNEKGEVKRKAADCEHIDKVESFKGKKGQGAITFRIPSGALRVGTLSICNLDRNHGYEDMGPAAKPVVFKVGGAAKTPPEGFQHRRMPHGRSSCMKVAEGLATGVDLDFEVEVKGSGTFEIAYIIAE